MVALAAALSLVTAGPALAGVKKGDRAREFVQVVDARGKRVSLKRYRDRVVVVTFGASWCAPCKKELPALEKLARSYSKKRAKVAFFAVNIDNEQAKGASFMRQAGLKAVQGVYDRQKATVESYDPPKMPSTFIIRGGVVRAVHAGYNSGDDRTLAKLIDRELKALR